jgi:hypothetical protein
MNPLRSLLAVLVGVGLISVVVEVLEFSLVNAIAGARIADLDTYFAIRNEPRILAAKLVYNTLAAVLGGYMAARIAGREEIQHGMMAAGVQTAALVWGFTLGEFASYTPVWMRIALVVVTGPAIVAGAWIRGTAMQVGRPGPTDPAHKETA